MPCWHLAMEFLCKYLASPSSTLPDVNCDSTVTPRVDLPLQNSFSSIHANCSAQCIVYLRCHVSPSDRGFKRSSDQSTFVDIFGSGRAKIDKIWALAKGLGISVSNRPTFRFFSGVAQDNVHERNALCQNIISALPCTVCIQSKPRRAAV